MTSNNRWYPLAVAAIAGVALLVGLLSRSIIVITWFVAFVAMYYTIQLVQLRNDEPERRLESPTIRTREVPI